MTNVLGGGAFGSSRRKSKNNLISCTSVFDSFKICGHSTWFCPSPTDCIFLFSFADSCFCPPFKYCCFQGFCPSGLLISLCKFPQAWLQVSHLHKQSFNPNHQLQPFILCQKTNKASSCYSTALTIISSWIVSSPKFICCSPNPQYFEMWLRLEIVFKMAIKLRWCH